MKIKKDEMLWIQSQVLQKSAVKPLHAPPFIGTLFIENLDLAIQSLLGGVCKGLNPLLFEFLHKAKNLRYAKKGKILLDYALLALCVAKFLLYAFKDWLLCLFIGKFYFVVNFSPIVFERAGVIVFKRRIQPKALYADIFHAHAAV